MDNSEKKIADDLMATPFSFADLVTYQTGSVVSRTIINKSAGTVTVFAFDAGEKLSTHSAPYDAMISIVDGEGLITIEEKPFTLKNGQQIIMPANKPHSVEALSRFKMVLTMIKVK